MIKLGRITIWVAVGATGFILSSCKEATKASMPTEAEILAEIKAEKEKEDAERKAKRQEDIDRRVAILRAEEEASSGAAAQPAAISEAPEIQAASPEAEPSPFVSNHVDESEKVAAANAIDPDRAARSAELQKARAVLDDLQKKRELMHEALTELSIKEDELIKAAKEARWGDRDAKLKLSGVDTAATVAADEAVAKHAEKMAQAQAKLDELQEKIEAARAAYNRI